MAQKVIERQHTRLRLYDRNKFKEDKLSIYLLYLSLSQTRPGFYVSAVEVF